MIAAVMSLLSNAAALYVRETLGVSDDEIAADVAIARESPETASDRLREVFYYEQERPYRRNDHVEEYIAAVIRCARD